MQSLSDIRALLAARGLRPKHRFGQNFLHDQNLLRRLVGASGVGPGDLVLEVGPGTGTLTEALLDAGAEVVACEIDRDLADLIVERLGDRIVLVRGDCLEKGRRLAAAARDALGGRSFRLVANLPYGAASPLIGTLLMHHPECRGLFVTIQREVADRLVAPPSTKDYGTLTVLAQTFGVVERIAVLPPTCFWPEPQVTSAMVSILPRTNHGVADPDDFAVFVTRLFAQRRKQLGTILGRDRTWPAGVEASMRPEVLAPATMTALWQACRDG